MKGQTVKFTDAQVTEAIEAAVAERGEDFIYPDEWTVSSSCVNADEEGNPRCIVGLTLHKLGVDLTNEEIQRGSVSQIVRLLDHPFTPAVAQALDAAQAVQDSADTWGKALKAYHEALSS